MAYDQAERPLKNVQTQSGLQTSDKYFEQCAYMKRKQLIRHIKKYNGFLLREGRRHSIYQKGRLKTEVPRHNEVVDELARKICKDLDIPFVR